MRSTSPILNREIGSGAIDSQQTKANVVREDLIVRLNLLLH
jgi:hypothetical protein